MNKLLELLFINSFKGIGKKTIHRKYIDAIWRCEDIYDLIGTYLPMIKVFSNADIDQAKTTAQRHIEELEEMLGEDFLTVFDTSPVPVSFNVSLDAAYVSPDSVAIVKTAIEKVPEVEEVVYHESLIEALNGNLSKISMVIGVFIILLLFISFVLISNTVRLNVYSRRFSRMTLASSEPELATILAARLMA